MPIFAFPKKTIFVGFALAFAHPGAALAQEGAGQGSQVTYDAPYTITHSSDNHDRSVEKISIARGVNFTDLNLSNPADVQTLQTRVKEAARDVCRQMERRFPSSDDDAQCIRGAVHDGLAKANTAVATANQNHPKVASLP